MTVGPTTVHSHRRRQLSPLVLVAALVLLGAGVALAIDHDLFRGSRASSATRGSGVAAVETRSVSDFAGVELAGSNNVTIHAGGKQSVVVRGDDNLLGHVTTQVDAGSLVIRTTGSFTTLSPMSVDVTVPSLATLTLSGSGTITADDVSAARLSVTLSGSGVLRASGTAASLDVSLEGSGDARLGDLVARNARAVVSGSGRIVVQATKTLDAAVPGSGEILYLGNPAHVSTSITGSGEVTPG